MPRKIYLALRTVHRASRVCLFNDLALESGDEGLNVNAHCSANDPKFNKVQAPMPGLPFANEALWNAEPVGKLGLLQPSVNSRLT